MVLYREPTISELSRITSIVDPPIERCVLSMMLLKPSTSA